VLAALGLAAAVALLAASTMSYLDWRLNPGGIFRCEDGTSWTVVWETWVSWFVPVLLLAAAVALPAALWSARGR